MASYVAHDTDVDDALMADIAMLGDRVSGMETHEREVAASVSEYKKSRTSESKAKAEASGERYKETIKEIAVTMEEVAKKSSISTEALKSKVEDYLEEKDAKRFRKLFQLQQSMSLCFVIDATASMGDIFEGVKDCVRQVIKDLQTEMEYFKHEISVVLYRDVNDKRRIETQDFTGSISQIEEFLGKATAEGGGDPCEDVVGGLHAASELVWNNKFVNRILLLICDAPHHGSEYHNGREHWDSYLSGDFPGKKDTKEVLNDLKQKGIVVNFMKCNDSTDKMIDKFKEVIPSIDTFKLNRPGEIPGDRGATTASLKRSLSISIKESIKSSVKSSFSSSSARMGDASAKSVKSRTRTLKKVGTVMSTISEGVEDGEDDEAKEDGDVSRLTRFLKGLTLSQNAENISALLENDIGSLEQLKKLVKSGDVDKRGLKDMGVSKMKDRIAIFNALK
jgi:hypothetical protein